MSTVVDLRVRLGDLELANPVVAASGTYGHGDEVARYGDPAKLGAVTAKSQAAFAWEGNPAPRVAPVAAGMLNAVGLPGRGIDHWVTHDLPPLLARDATVIASIWGRTVDDYAQAARAVAGSGVAALEINLSCPNVEHHSEMFAHDPGATRDVVTAVLEADAALPLLAKLSPNVTDIVVIATAAREAGADALTLVNTVLGLGIDASTRRPLLGRGVGGLSGAAIKPIALRAVHEVHSAHPDVPIVGTGGVSSATDAVEMLLAGATAVGVGTATFENPRAPERIARSLERWCRRNGVASVADLTGGLDRP